MGTSNETENARGAPLPGLWARAASRFSTFKFKSFKFEEPVSLTLQLGVLGLLKCRTCAAQYFAKPKSFLFKNRRVDVFTAHVAAVLSTRIYSRSEEFRMVDV